MSVWAITMVKDEIDVIEPVLRHVAAQGVEGIIVADNGSTDGTYEALRRLHLELDCDLLVIPDPEVAYYQSAKMSKLAEQAHAAGAEWVWPFDADELWYLGNEGKKLAEVIEHQDADVIQTRLWPHFCTALDPAVTARNPFERMCYRSGEEAPIGKVIIRWRPGTIIEQGNHDLRMPGSHMRTETDIQIRHFPYRSEDQFVTKAINGAAAYAAAEDLDFAVGQHWREYGIHYARGGEDALREIFRAHFYYDLPSADGLVYDPARIDS